jgi:hypothetical protein
MTERRRKSASPEWKIHSRQDLVKALQDAAEVEHQLMCVYLYAALSLKKDADAKARPSQIEAIRRWASTVYMVAREEMEHLSLANGILSAIGERPWFARENIGKQGLLSPYLTPESLERRDGPSGCKPREIPYSFVPFTGETLGHLVCAESPDWQSTPEKLKPWWCYDCASVSGEGARLLAHTAAPHRRPLLARQHFKPPHESLLRSSAAGDFHAGLIQELYSAIREAILEMPGLFTGDPTKQVIIPVEYNIYVSPVRDAATAVRAIDQILTEGEGVEETPGYESHFQLYWDVLREFVEQKERDPDFEPGLALLSNPERGEITNPFTGRVFDTFNYGYETLLLMLDALYTYHVPEPAKQKPSTDKKTRKANFSTALQEMAFAPAMTMLIRSLGEVLVQLDIDERGRRTGPNFFISREVAAILEHQPGTPRLDDIKLFLERWEKLTAELDALAREAPEHVQANLSFIYENTWRIRANLRQIAEKGYFEKFHVPEPEGGS